MAGRLWLTALTVLALGCEGKHAMGVAHGGREGAAFPTVTGTTLAGQPFSSDDLRGHVVLINIWATWCPPCIAELPSLQRFNDRYGADRFTVIAVSVDGHRAEPDVRRIVAQLGVSFPIVLDPESRVVSQLAIDGFPTTLLVARDGTIVWRRDGMIEANDIEVDERIRWALNAGPGHHSK